MALARDRRARIAPVASASDAERAGARGVAGRHVS